MARETKPAKIRWRLWIGLAAWSAVFVSSAFAARTVQRFMLTDPRFELVQPELVGVEFTSRYRIMQTFAPDAGRSVFRVPLAERRRRLLAIDWIEEASLARIWPNRLVVRVKERKPAAFVNLHRPLLIDAQGVLLTLPRKRFQFPILNGVSEEQSEDDRRDRVEAMQRLYNDLGPQAAKQISEVDATSVADLRVTAAIQGRAIQLWMGDRNFGSRYRNFVDHYPEIRRHSPAITKFDLRIDDRIITRP